MSKQTKCTQCGGTECGVTEPPSQKTYEWVIESIEEKLDKVLAVSYALETILKPSGDFEGNITAWRLSQIISEYLNDTSLLKEARKALGCEVES